MTPPLAAEVAQAPPLSLAGGAHADGAQTTIELLRQILDVQREQLQHTRQAQANADPAARWRQFLQRYRDDFPHLPQRARRLVPRLERGYLELLDETVQQLAAEDDTQDFAFWEAVERATGRLGQMGMLLSVLGPLGEAAEGETAGP